MRTMRLLLLIALLVCLCPRNTLSASGQVDGTTYTSEQTGKLVDFGDAAEARFDLDNTYTEEDGEYYYEHIAIERGTSLIYVVFTNQAASPLQWKRNSHEFSAPNYQVYEILDEQVQLDRYSSVIRVTTKMNFTEIVYDEYQPTWIDGDPLNITVFATESTLVDDLHWTRDNVTVDGQPITLDTDYSHLQSVLEGTSGVEPRIFTDHITTVSDWEEQGLVSENEWVSPHYGVTLNWDEQWKLSFQKWDAIYTEDGGLDGVSLATEGREGEVNISVTEPTADRSTPEDWLERWTSEEFLDLTGGAQSFTILDTELTEDSASVILLATTWHGEEFITVFDAYVPQDGPTIVRRVNATRENIGDIMTLTWNGIRANGELVPHSWTQRDFETLMAN